MEDTKKRLLRYLNDARAAEEGGTVALEHLAAQAPAGSELRAIATEHLGVTHTQANRLTMRILALGGKVEAAKGVMNTAIAFGSKLANVFHDADDQRTQDVIKAYSLEHFEMGMYTSLAVYARAVGDERTAELADTLLGEERLAAEQFFRLIPGLAEVPATKTPEPAPRPSAAATSGARSGRGLGRRPKSRAPIIAGAAVLGLGAAVVTMAVKRRGGSSGGENDFEGNGGTDMIENADVTENVVVPAVNSGRDEGSDPLGPAHFLTPEAAEAARAAERITGGKVESPERQSMYGDVADSGEAGSMGQPTGQDDRNPVGPHE